MSLDVYLTKDPETVPCKCECGHGHTKTVSEEVYWSNITHNLGGMASEAGIYKHLWRPEEIGITKAGQLIEPLANAIALMQSDPERFKKFDASNGWGIYEQFVPWVENYRAACALNPDANVSVSR